MIYALLAFAFLFATGVVWVAGLFLGWSLGLKIGLTLGFLALVLAVVLFLFLRKRRAAKRLARGILGADEGAAAGAQPNLELVDVRRKLGRALGKLKKGRFGGGGEAALHRLPWYVIIGPPGVGKTTAIVHSELEFPLDTPEALPGAAGTRNCDWWITQDAILLDTAGRYTATSSEATEWLDFLELLRKTRGEKPISGLIVAISVVELAHGAEGTRREAARRIRTRIDEVVAKLRINVPVYLMLTKCDLVPGFVEAFSDLRRDERNQVWGFTVPLATKDSAAAAFDREFSLLLSTLHGRLLVRMKNERQLWLRRRLNAFVSEIGALKAPLADFLTQLFRPTAEGEKPFFRGLYFTSGTQVGFPTTSAVNALLSGYRLGFDPSRRTRTFELRDKTEPRSYFVTDIFRNVLRADRELVAPTEREQKRKFLLRASVAGFALLSASALVFPACITHANNRSLLGETRAMGDAIINVRWGDQTNIASELAPLDRALERLHELEAWNEETPVQLGWGLYSGRKADEALGATYAEALHRLVVTRTHADLTERLRGLDEGPVRNADSFSRDFDLLKLYLMLGTPDRLEPAWAAPRLARQWRMAVPTRTEADEAKALPHLAHYLERLKRGAVRPWPIDEKLVTRARSILKQVPQVERLYESLIRDANTELVPIRREAIFYGAVAPWVQSRKGVKVDGAYTKAGWMRVQPLLTHEREKLSAERWVLGETGDVNEDIEKVKELYFERYKNAWRDFLADLQVQDPGNPELALEQLNALSEPEWPYLRLMRVLQQNVTLELEEPSLAEKAMAEAKNLLDGGTPGKTLNERKPSPVEVAFGPMLRFGLPPETLPPGTPPPPTALSQYQGLLSKLVAALSDVRDAETGTDPKKVGDVFQEAFRSTSALLSEQDGFTRPLLSPLLMNPITLAWSSVVQDAGLAAGAQWESQVWARFHDKLEGRYPFAANGPDAVLGDVIDFFHPGDGTLWSFYDEVLKATIDRAGNRFVPSRRFKSAIGYTNDFLDNCLRRGQELTSAFFPPKADNPTVVFEVNLRSVSRTVAEVTLTVDGQSRKYRNEPEKWFRVQWPGSGARGASLHVRGSGGLNEQLNRPGDFGLFRLLEDADVKPAPGKNDASLVFVATWELRAPNEPAVVQLDFRPARRENPLTPGFFRNYSCPRRITTK